MKDLTVELYKLQREVKNLEDYVLARTTVIEGMLERLRLQVKQPAVAQAKAVLKTSEDIAGLREKVSDALARLENLEAFSET
mgnify:FL=1